MKIVFMGTSGFAVSSLEKLIEKHEVLAVVTQPDKPKGRGRKMAFSPVKEVALKNGIPVFQPVKIGDEESIAEMEKFRADIFVVAAYGQFLPKSIRDMPKYGCINVHGSLLPKYRGASPIQQAIIDGEEITGVTIIYMDEKLDVGDMLLKKEIKIEPEDTYGSLHDKMSVLGADILLEAIKLIENGEAKPVKQDDALSSYASKIFKEMGNIEWEKTSREIVNFIRGLNPSPGAYTFYKGETIKIWRAEQIDGYDYGKAGEVIDVPGKKGVVVKTGDSAILIKEVQAKGGKKMSCADYIRGHAVEKGSILG